MRTRLFNTTCLAALLGLTLASGIAQAQTSNDSMKKTDTMKSDPMKSGTMSKDGMKTDTMKKGGTKADCMHKAGMEKDSMKKADMMKSCDAINDRLRAPADCNCCRGAFVNTVVILFP